MGQGVLLSAGADIDFMVHGVFSYEIFGQTAWITTTHVCVLIIMLVLIILWVEKIKVVRFASYNLNFIVCW